MDRDELFQQLRLWIEETRTDLEALRKIKRGLDNRRMTLKEANARFKKISGDER